MSDQVEDAAELQAFSTMRAEPKPLTTPVSRKEPGIFISHLQLTKRNSCVRRLHLLYDIEKHFCLDVGRGIK